MDCIREKLTTKGNPIIHRLTVEAFGLWCHNAPSEEVENSTIKFTNDAAMVAAVGPEEPAPMMKEEGEHDVVGVKVLKRRVGRPSKGPSFTFSPFPLHRNSREPRITNFAMEENGRSMLMMVILRSSHFAREG